METVASLGIAMGLASFESRLKKAYMLGAAAVKMGRECTSKADTDLI